ncbi:MAG: sensor histidine kinase [Candidatus Gastranaerophilaceae bacterium]
METYCPVIFNLVDNAMKYSPVKTSVTVSAKAVGRYIEISVADEGNGIKDEDKKKIYVLYSCNSIADGRRGLGLGLALCKAVVSAHGGVIEIKDNKPKGTIFSFKLIGEFYE